MGGAIQRSEKKVMQAVDKIEEDLSGKIAAGHEKINKVEGAFEDVLARQGKLESGQPSMAHKGGAISTDRPNASLWRLENGHEEVPDPG